MLLGERQAVDKGGLQSAVAHLFQIRGIGGQDVGLRCEDGGGHGFERAVLLCCGCRGQWSCRCLCVSANIEHQLFKAVCCLGDTFKHG